MIFRSRSFTCGCVASALAPSSCCCPRGCLPPAACPHRVARHDAVRCHGRQAPPPCVPAGGRMCSGWISARAGPLRRRWPGGQMPCPAPACGMERHPVLLVMTGRTCRRTREDPMAGPGCLRPASRLPLPGPWRLSASPTWRTGPWRSGCLAWPPVQMPEACLSRRVAQGAESRIRPAAQPSSARETAGGGRAGTGAGGT